MMVAPSGSLGGDSSGGGVGPRRPVGREQVRRARGLGIARARAAERAPVNQRAALRARAPPGKRGAARRTAAAGAHLSPLKRMDTRISPMTNKIYGNDEGMRPARSGAAPPRAGSRSEIAS